MPNVDQIALVDTQGNRSVFEYETGNALLVPTTISFRVTGTGADFVDGQQFDITSPDGLTTHRLEINTAGIVGGGIPVDLTTAGTVAEVRQAFLDALQPLATDLDLVLRPIDNDVIQLGTISGHSVTPVAGPVTNLEIFGVAGGISKWFHAMFDKDEDVDKAILQRRKTLLDERNKKQQRQP